MKLTIYHLDWQSITDQQKLDGERVGMDEETAKSFIAALQELRDRS